MLTSSSLMARIEELEAELNTLRAEKTSAIKARRADLVSYARKNGKKIARRTPDVGWLIYEVYASRWSAPRARSYDDEYLNRLTDDQMADQEMVVLSEEAYKTAPMAL